MRIEGRVVEEDQILEELFLRPFVAVVEGFLFGGVGWVEGEERLEGGAHVALLL